MIAAPNSTRAEIGASQINAWPGHWLPDEKERQEVQQSSGCGYEEAGNGCALGASTVGKVTRPESREQRRAKLCAGDEADHEGAKSQALVHMEREHRQS